jgi:ATP-dependent helicase HrpB
MSDKKNGPIGQILRETGLPLVPRLGEIVRALEERGLAVVRSDPGSGKSTLIPLALLDRLSPGEGRILMAEPRRAAAVGICERMAELLGEKAGGRTGYAVRLERRVSPATRVEVLTDGLLVRRIQGDPGLKGVSTVIFDEFHERSVYTDLALALILDLRRMGLPIRLLIMSATMDAARIGAFIDSVENRSGPDKTPVFDCPGRAFPVKIEYRPVSGALPLGIAAARALSAILDEGETGDVLVFLPGKGEIAAAARALEEAGQGEARRILPLHGALPLARQREVIAPGPRAGTPRQRIILSTNIAETGLTVPGITLVVDSGYARIERFHLPTGMNRLCREAVSLEAADQRAGRAGRLMPGRCIRLWEEAQGRSVAADREINRIDLAGLVLESLLWGVRRREELPWPDIPPEPAWERGRELLLRLGAADSGCNPTGRGRDMARLGLHPRLGALCLAGKAAGQGGLAAAAAALLSERDGSGIPGDADFCRRLALIRTAREGKAEGGTETWARGIIRIAGDLLRRLGYGGDALVWSPREEASVGELLKAAFPDRIARRVGENRFRFVSGREGTVEGPLAGAEWILAVEVDAGERSARIGLAAPLSDEGAREALAGETREESRVEWKGLVPRRTLTLRAGRLVLTERKEAARREDLLPVLGEFLAERGLDSLPWDGEGIRLLERIRFFVREEDGRGTDAGLWTEAALCRTAAAWIGPFIEEGGPLISGAALVRALETRLGWEQKQELDRRVPGSFTLPNGKKRPLEYGTGEPVLRLRLQDAFGIGEEKRVLGKPIVFHLLSPANRPIQITSDLPGFWAGSYAEVRKEMRGRYPKHPWPQNPAAR